MSACGTPKAVSSLRMGVKCVVLFLFFFSFARCSVFFGDADLKKKGNTTVSITIFAHTGKTGNEIGGKFVSCTLPPFHTHSGLL